MKNRFPAWTIPIALLFICILAYGPLIRWLGFFWDDWPTLWFLDRFGPGIFSKVYSIDRPALGWLFSATTALVGKTTLAWQIFSILTRWFACLSLWWLLREAWPNKKLENTWVVFLFALYPGFLQQPIAFTYSADWIAISLFFLSFWCMLRAVRGARWSGLFWVTSWLLAAYVMFADEYYFGLELLRPVFLWMVIDYQALVTKESSTKRQRALRVVRYWFPYLLIMFIFLYWRLFVFISPRGQLQFFEQLADQPIHALITLANRLLSDIFQSSVSAWAQTIDLRFIPGLKSPLVWVYLVLSIFAALATFFYFINFPKEKPDEEPNSRGGSNTWAMQASLVGVIALIVGGWPFWLTDLPMELYFPWDRFNLAMMLGTSLVMGGLTIWLARTPKRKAIVFGIIVGLATGFHLYNTSLYKQEWQTQKDLFWQLTWRAPQFKPGTLLLTADMPFRYFSDNSLTAPLNLIYAPENSSLQLPFMLYNIESRLGAGLAELRKGIPVSQAYRIASYQGNTSNAIVFFYDPPNCLKVIDPTTDALMPNKPRYIDIAAGLSNLGQIIDDPVHPAKPPQQFFGFEPQPGWCTYFEKAELARQSSNWQEVARLADMAMKTPYQLTRRSAAELIPFIQGYGYTQQWTKAEDLTRSAYEYNPKLANMLCPIWYDIRQTARDSIEAYNTFAKIAKLMDCEYEASQVKP
jgi:hypothetical protein